MFDRKSLLLTVLFVLIISVSAAGMAIYVLSDQGIKDAFLLSRVAGEIRDLFPEDYDHSELIISARKAMLGRLDRYSGYMDKLQFDRLHEELSGGYDGLGITIVQDTMGLVIISVRENGPAAAAGLLIGDMIIQADSTILAGLNSSESTRLLRGKEGTEVSLVIIRPSIKDTLRVSVTRERIPLLHIPFAGITPDSMIYIRLLDFESGASEDIKAALDSLYTNQNKKSIRGMILDLRSNPGGLFGEARKVADLFLEDGTRIVGTTGRSRWENQQFFASEPDRIEGLPMAVIVDRGSASSSEVVAGALQQAGRAVLVGDTTYGKGLVQGFVRFPDGDGLRLTISRYYVGDSLYLNQFDSVLNEIGQGLAPDHLFEFSDRHPAFYDLERSLLLFRFAEENKQEISSSSDGNNSEHNWLDKFIAYAKQEGFEYESQSSEEIAFLQELAKTSGSSEKFISRLSQWKEKSEAHDLSELDRNRTYLSRRLRQLAIQSSAGEYEAYRQVIVPEQPVINYAASLLGGGGH